MATPVSDSDFQSEVLESSVPVLVDFYAPWCGPCKSMLPVVEELAASYEGKAKVVKVNVDDSPDTAQKYGVMSIPQFVLINDGEAVDTLVGMQSKENLQGKIDALL